MDRQKTLIALICFSMALADILLPICPLTCLCGKTIVSCRSKRLNTTSTNFIIEPTIEILDYSGNKLDELNPKQFNIKGIENIKQLYVNESNIASINQHTFTNLTNLEVLDLSDNMLEAIPSKIIQENTKIRALKLSMNIFRKTPELYSTSLQVLDLTDSQLFSFTEKNVMYLPNLQVLFLQQNNLQSLSPNTFLLSHKLIRVELSYNNWKCSCATAKMFDVLYTKGVLDIEEPIRCRQSRKKFVDLLTKEGGVFWQNYCLNSTKTGVENDKILPLIESQKLDNSSSVVPKGQENTKSSSHTVLWVVLLSCLLFLSVVSAYFCYVQHRKKKNAYKKLSLAIVYTNN